jgi:DNA polymerase I
MKGFLLDIDYETMAGRAVIKLFFKGAGGFFVASDDSFTPYFYVLYQGDAEEVKKRLKELKMVADIVEEEKSFLGVMKKVLKVNVVHPQEVPKLREVVKNLSQVEEIYEHDILFVRRYLIDKDLRPLTWVEVEGMPENGDVRLINFSPIEGEAPEMKVLAFDTEVYNPRGAPRSEKDPIIMVSLASNTGLRKVLTWKRSDKSLEYVEVLKNERETLKRFCEIVNEEDYDIILGYNSDNFDFPYLRDRVKRLGMDLPLGRRDAKLEMKGRRGLKEARIRGRPHLDLYHIIRRSVKLSSYVLENVVKELLGYEKEKIPGENLWKYWDAGGEKLEKLLEYSMEDAEAALRLGEKFLPLQYELTKMVQQPLFDVSRMTAGQLVEWLLMKEASRSGEIIPNRPAGIEYSRRMKDTYLGGYVREPKKGIVEDVAVFDFRSLYPSVIVTHNIDPSTLIENDGDGEEAPGLGYRFTRERRGFIPQILQGLIHRRAEIKRDMVKAERPGKKGILDAKQRALKLLANSFYGYMGYPRARWYRRKCAESVTAYARMYIQRVMRIAEEDFGLEVVYGDTDSLFVVVPKEDKGKIKELLEDVNASLPGMIELEYEGFYTRAIFVTKKRYALIDEEGKITVKGLEFVRRDWAPIAKKTQEKVLRVLLMDADPEKAANLVRKTVEAIKDRKVSLEDLTIYTQLTKSIKSYKNIEPHVEAAKKLQEIGRKVTPGMIIGYVITKGREMISQRAVPVELVSVEDYDPDYYIDNQILPAVLRIIESIGYSRDYLKDGMKQESLKRWFN